VGDAPDDPHLPDVLTEATARFGAALDDDLNVSAGLAVLFDLVRDVNRRLDARSLSSGDVSRILETVHDLDRVLGILPAEEEDVIPGDIARLLAARIEARAARDWPGSDRLRDELAERGFTVEDTRDGQRWRRSGMPEHG